MFGDRTRPDEPRGQSTSGRSVLSLPLVLAALVVALALLVFGVRRTTESTLEPPF